MSEQVSLGPFIAVEPIPAGAALMVDPAAATARVRAPGEQAQLRRTPSPTQDIEHRFAFHAATDEEKRNAHSSAREACKRAALHLQELCPPGRELSLALTKLEEAMFWGNAALARQR